MSSKSNSKLISQDLTTHPCPTLSPHATLRITSARRNARTFWTWTTSTLRTTSLARFSVTWRTTASSGQRWRSRIRSTSVSYSRWFSSITMTDIKGPLITCFFSGLQDPRALRPLWLRQRQEMRKLWIRFSTRRVVNQRSRIDLHTRVPNNTSLTSKWSRKSI